jgi:hypothetical protein
MLMILNIGVFIEYKYVSETKIGASTLAFPVAMKRFNENLQNEGFLIGEGCALCFQS